MRYHSDLYKRFAMARRFFLIFCLFLTALAFSYDKEAKEEIFASTPEQIASTGCLVGGLIHPLSGAPALSQTDFVVQSAQPLILSRTYLSPFMPTSFSREKHRRDEWEKYHLFHHVAKSYKGWQYFPHLKLKSIPSEKRILLTQPTGGTLSFVFTGDGLTQAQLEGPHYGITNCAGEVPSGRYDVRNTQITFGPRKETLTIFGSDSYLRLYRFNKWETDTEQLYFLEKEILPNGKVIKYHYKNERLARIDSLDPKERTIYASIHVKGSPWVGNVHFESSLGHCADATYEQRPLRAKIKTKTKRWYGNDTAKTEYNFLCPPILTKVSAPNFRHERISHCGRFLLCDYEGKEHKFRIVNRGYGEGIKHYRAHQLLHGSDCLYELNYHPPLAGKTGGYTTVKKADGTKAIYHFTKDLLNSKIEHFDEEGALQLQKIFSWDESHYLKSLEVRDGQGALFSQKTYEYDQFGNPIFETLSGPGIERQAWIKRQFSTDGRHLLLREELDNGKVTTYTYLEGTNLLTSKSSEGRTDYWKYDEWHNLIEKGTEGLRKTTYTLRSAPPFLHMVKWAIESSSEKLLGKRHFTYDQFGHIAKEAVYDENGEFAYAIERTFSERGDLLSETNPLGLTATYTYDTHGRRASATNFSQRLQMTYTYDAQGRLIRRAKKGDDGSCRLESFDYDTLDRCIKKVDSFGNETHYTHSSSTLHTELPNHNKHTSTFDPLGREIAHIDANGNTTTYTYNVYGAPTEISHPSGGIETFHYSGQGELITHIDPDGLVTNYEYDLLGRLTQKTRPEWKESFTYDRFHLIASTNGEGRKTHFTYDSAGRKICEESAGRTLEFAYDPLGHLLTTYKYCGGDALVTHYQRDLEGRILRKTQTNLAQELLADIAYAYDADGNKTLIESPTSTQSFSYDPFNRRILYRDPLGYETHTIYNEAHQNALGQNVLQVKTINPNGEIDLSTYDVNGRKVSIEKAGSTTSYTYDPCGNLLTHKTHEPAQTIHYTYTPDHHLATITDQEGQITTLTHSPGGKKTSKTFPDGTTLTYTYDPLGHLARIDSSCGTIAHSFTHNKLGALIKATDERHNLTIHRELDPFGNVLKETFPHGITVSKTYDTLDRPLSLTIENHAHIRYTYDPLHLKAIERFTPQGLLLYTHTYDTYDLSGHLTRETPIGPLAPTTTQKDPRGQITRIDSPYFTQECDYDPLHNLKATTIDGHLHTFHYDQTGQLTQENGHTYTFDPLYNRTHKDDQPHTINPLNQLLSDGDTLYEYDLRGNRVHKSPRDTYHYDPLGRLIEVTTDQTTLQFTYDPLGRRLAKNNEFYIYDGEEEIGSFKTPETLDSLKVQSTHLRPRPVAIELKGKVYAPITDVQGSIRRLIATKTKAISARYDFTAFGERLNSLRVTTPYSPWQYASKRLDPELGFIYFGKRYYDPTVGRWLTPDPAGIIDSTNLYQYALNNPFRYYDPNGMFLLIPALIEGGATLGISWGAPAVGAVAGPVGIIVGVGVAIYGGYKAYDAYQNRTPITPPPDPIDGLSYTGPHTHDWHYSGITAVPVQSGYGNTTYIEKRHSPDQEALSELAKENERKGVSNADADTLLEWGNEYNYPNTRDDRGKLNENGKPHWVGGEHIHLGPKHIKVK